MTVTSQDAYVGASGAQPLTHARILHRGNRQQVRQWEAITTTTDTSQNLDALLNGMTYERAKMFTNEVQSPSDLSDTDVWTPLNCNVSSDGQTLTETTDNGQHRVLQDYIFAATDYVLSATVVRGSAAECQIVIIDSGATTHSLRFDFRTGLADGNGGDAAGDVFKLSENRYLIKFYATVASGAGTFGIRFNDGDNNASYAGDVDNNFRVERMTLHRSQFRLQATGFGQMTCNAFCLAGHNLGSGNTRVRVYHDENDDGTFTYAGMSALPVDDSPIWFYADDQASKNWEFRFDVGVMPEVGVIRFGYALEMPRPFYGGFTPSQGARDPIIRGNTSELGRSLGRSLIRSSKSVTYPWRHLETSWVEANVYGQDGLIRALEDEPFFIAWRLEDTQDVDYAHTSGRVTTVSKMGIRDLMQMSIDATVEGYDHE